MVKENHSEIFKVEQNVDDLFAEETKLRLLDNKTEEFIEKNDGLWECKVCGKTSVKKDNAKNHVETHLEGISHSCPVCNKTFRTRDSMKTHKRNNHSDVTLICNVCGQSGMSRMKFKNHKAKCQRKLQPI